MPSCAIELNRVPSLQPISLTMKSAEINGGRFDSAISLKCFAMYVERPVKKV
jgi:hypothetical protein